MLKQQLLDEAHKIDAVIELDSVFEGMNLSEDTKAKFSTVFEATVKSQTVKLAESHITAIAEKAEVALEEAKEKIASDMQKSLYEDANKYFEHLAERWLEENKLAVSKGIKADLFESMFAGMKDLFIEHNVVIPEESVDVVAEMEDELTESQDKIKDLFEDNAELKSTISGMKREAVLKESTAELTETQKEKVSSLIEGMDYSDAFSTKLEAIVEMVVASTKAPEEKPVDESAINNSEDHGLNYQEQPITEDKSTEYDPMDIYNAATSRLA
ncbi:head scaffolding protein [Serratia phage 92A1]|nr:head scaffolding protein [Serratia phage 92A1]